MVRKGPADVRPDGEVLSGKGHFVIFNPASGRGRGAARIERYRQLLTQHLPGVTFGTTERPGGERELAEKAIADGYRVIVAVGGDGTWSNVADRVVASERDDLTLGILPNGTGNDFGRNFGYDPKNPEEAVRVLALGSTRQIDVGRLDTATASEHDPTVVEARHFLNLIGFGFDIAVIDAAAGARFLTGELLYKVTALQQLFRFPGISPSVRSSSEESASGRQLMLTVSNGRYFGGGFPIAPAATVVDGRLHACVIGDAPPLTRLKLFNLAERGRHVESERVRIIDDERFEITFAEPPRFEMDGDVRRADSTTLNVRCLRGALRVAAPAA